MLPPSQITISHFLLTRSASRPPMRLAGSIKRLDPTKKYEISVADRPSFRLRIMVITGQIMLPRFVTILPKDRI